MALPVFETFTATDGTYLVDHSASWTEEVLHEFVINSNSVNPNRAGARLEFGWWNADSFDNNQYAQAVVAAIGSSHYMGVCVRVSSGGNGYSAFWSTDAGLVLRKTVSGTETDLGSTSAPAVNDVIRIEANGTSIVVKKNGTAVITVTDSSLTSGAAGICEYGGSTVTRLDTWEAGNLASTVTKTHTTDALLRKTQTASHTSDALLRGAFTISHATDALLRATSTRTHSTDAFLASGVGTQTRTHTTDALLRASGTRTHTTDALLHATSTRSHSTDAFLRATQTKTHTTDALLKATKLRLHSTDALLRSTTTRTHTTDALLVSRLTLTHSTDAFLSQGAIVLTHSTDALLRATRLRTHTTDAYLQSFSQAGLGILEAIEFGDGTLDHVHLGAGEVSDI